MIAFFRKLRQKLPGENRAGKFLLYAVGEIVLVVIGILIALQVDNWNEERKTRTRLYEILAQVQSELESNISTADNLVEYYAVKDSLTARMLYHTLPGKEVNPDTDWRQFTIIFSRSLFLPKDNAIETLLEFKEDLDSEADSIIRGLKDLNPILAAIDESGQRMLDIADTYRKYLVYNTDWFSDFYSGADLTETMIQHFLNDPIHRNNLVWLRAAMTNNYSGRLIQYAHQARLLHKNIAEVLGDTTANAVGYKKIPEAVFDRYTGSYYSEEQVNKEPIRLFSKDGSYYLKNGADTLELYFTDAETFFLSGRIKFRLLSDGSFISRNNGDGQFDPKRLIPTE